LIPGWPEPTPELYHCRIRRLHRNRTDESRSSPAGPAPVSEGAKKISLATMQAGGGDGPATRCRHATVSQAVLENRGAVNTYVRKGWAVAK
jgi:hypothetical protein